MVLLSWDGLGFTGLGSLIKLQSAVGLVVTGWSSVATTAANPLFSVVSHILAASSGLVLMSMLYNK